MINQESAAASISLALSADHERLDRLFDDACTRVGAGDFPGATMSFSEFARGLLHHIAVEERSLFPAFDARARMPGPTAVMCHEHRAIERSLALAADALTSLGASRFATEAAELSAILAAHNMKEERIIYPRSDAALDETERAAVLEALRR
ncbi:MAG TPA: hemerythrin domain-containing protein [Polyangia bacterium]|nr:hemerythrin domain-containing protein [Polyangia bacterium]